jgi:hypothetical protein
MKPPDKLYEFHVANLRAIDTAMSRVARSLREAISIEDNKTISAFTRLYALLLGAWAECRLRKLIYEPNGFDEQERILIRSKSTQLERWQTAVETAFRKHYNVPRACLSDTTLPHSAYSRYATILDMLDNDLRPTIELRNKLAHGQWVYPLNNEGNDVAQEQMNALRLANLLSLQFKKALISHLSNAIHDLVVSLPTFERDFDKHYRDIVSTRRNLKTRDYESWVKQMQEKYQRGKTRRVLTLQCNK